MDTMPVRGAFMKFFYFILGLESAANSITKFLVSGIGCRCPEKLLELHMAWNGYITSGNENLVYVENIC